jgi:beta-1,4-mannosyltransferase
VLPRGGADAWVPHVGYGNCVSITREALGRDVRSGGTLRVASVPSGHVYVRHLSPTHGPHPVQRLRDPDPDDPRRSAEQRWWPPVMLRPDWVETADIDVFHVQFGFDTCTPEVLRELVGVLRRRGIPLVFTVHDLRNPHHRDRREHDAQLDVLVPAADAVITLTPGAAAEIARRWGVEALVLPHPHVVELAQARALRERPRSGPWTVGLHVKSLRASMDPLRVLPTLVDQVAAMPDARLLVNGHRDVLDEDGARRDPELASYLHEAQARGDLELHVHDYLSDDELWAYLAALDVSVLPYRFGTHSGWLEACRDLGTTVVAPDCGYFADQGPILSYAMGEDRYDADSLRAALLAARTDPPPPADLDARVVQRDEVAAAHLALYRQLVR